MLTKRAPDSRAVLKSYQRILTSKLPIEDDEQSLIKNHLKLSGLVVSHNSILQPRNLIYRNVFSQSWINENLPSSIEVSYDSIKVSSISILATTLAVALMRSLGLFFSIETSNYDLYSKLLPANETHDSRIILVSMNNPDFEGSKNNTLTDDRLTKLINLIEDAQPSVVGIDIVSGADVSKNGPAIENLQEYENLVISRYLDKDERTYPEGSIQSSVNHDFLVGHSGFNSIPVENRDVVRECLLGDFLFNSPGNQMMVTEEFRFSFAVRVAEKYLKIKQNIELENGQYDNQAMRFGTLEIPRIQSKIGNQGENTGVRTLLSQRRSDPPFRVVYFDEITKGKVDVSFMNGRVVLVGHMDPQYSNVFKTSRTRYIYGLELQAHCISQVISAVIDGRPLLVASTGNFLFFSLLGTMLALISSKGIHFILGVLFVIFFIYFVGYLLFLFVGIWSLLTPFAFAFSLSAFFTKLYKIILQLRRSSSLHQLTD